MSERSGTLDALKPKELIELLDRMTIAEASAMDIDADAIGRAIDLRKVGRTGLSTLLRAFARLSGDGADLALTSLTPAAFGRFVTHASKEQIQSVMVDPALRATLLDEVFRRMGVHLRKDADVDAVIHWRLTGGAGEDGYDRYETVVADGAYTVNRTMNDQAKATVTLSPVDFLKLITATASASVMFMTGKLKVRGDLAFVVGLSNLFSIPRG